MRRALLYVPAAAGGYANALAASFAVSPPDAPDFSIPLTPDGTTITHYACCPDPGPSLTAMLPSLKAGIEGSDYHLWEGDYTTDARDAWLAARGLAVYSPPSPE
jgi:hypothetical protein